MTVVNVPQNLGGDGLPFSDGSESARDMGGASGQGYATHFLPLIAQLVAAGNTMVGAGAIGAQCAGHQRDVIPVVERSVAVISRYRFRQEKRCRPASAS